MFFEEGQLAVERGLLKSVSLVIDDAVRGPIGKAVIHEYDGVAATQPSQRAFPKKRSTILDEKGSFGIGDK